MRIMRLVRSINVSATPAQTSTGADYMGKIIGIDLGTTNSVVSVMQGGEPQVIPNQEGARTTPSVVGITKGGERLVGQVAKRQAITNPENTIYSIKRFMGRRANEVSDEMKMVPYKVKQQGDHVVVVAQGKDYTPPEISAMILQKLKKAAEDYLGTTVTEAVITVPAQTTLPLRSALPMSLLTLIQLTAPPHSPPPHSDTFSPSSAHLFLPSP